MMTSLLQRAGKGFVEISPGIRKPGQSIYKAFIVNYPKEEMTLGIKMSM